VQLSATRLPKLQVDSRIAAHRRNFRKEEDPRRSTAFAQTARHNEPVAAIVAFATEDQNVTRGKIGESLR
jgi:hypothetical protein